jgi:hypothetical protein
MRQLISLFLFAALVGCSRDQKGGSQSATEAGSGNYCQLGPVGLSVESARNGKARGRNMFGQDGESAEDIFTIKTRFKLLDNNAVVKQPALQRDGMMFGGAGLKLKDESGREFKPMGAGGFGAARNRRTTDVILNKAENGETTDVLTFESVADATGDLTLEVSANYQLQQPNDSFLQPTDPGTFRIRIPRAMWESEPPTVEAGPGNWATVGPVSVAVEGVRVGKVKMQGIGGTGDSKDDVFAVTVKVKLVDPKARVKKPPFIPDGLQAFESPSVTLKPRAGEAFPVIVGVGLDRIVGRQGNEIELTADKPEVSDLLTFDAKAAKADALILTLWPAWQERKPDGTWTDPGYDGDFRFRIPKAMWTK